MTNTIETASDIGIVEKLLAWDRGIPDFIGDKYPTCETVSHRNPDGPEAAAIIMEMVEALEAAKTVIINEPFFNSDLELIEVVARIVSALAKVRSK